MNRRNPKYENPLSLVHHLTKRELREIVRNKIKNEFTLDDMLKCFEESRLTHPMIGFKHLTFEEYLTFIKHNEKTQ
jgi:hypothetical protein